MILNAHDKVLLIALRRGNHFKANPGVVTDLLGASLGDLGPSEGLSSARRLASADLAAFVTEADGQARLRITDKGIAMADNLVEEGRAKTWKEWLASISRSDWIALGSFLTSVGALIVAILALSKA